MHKGLNMKNIRFILFAAVLSLVAACVREEIGPGESTGTGSDVVETVSLSIDVMAEGDSSDNSETKAYLNNGEMAWNSADYIYVFDDKNTGYVFTYKDGKFSYDSWPVDRIPAYALYDRVLDESTNAAKRLRNDEIKITTSTNAGHAGINIIAIPRSIQSAGNLNSFAGNANLSVGKIVESADSGYSVELKNVLGLIKFTMSEKPQKVVFQGNNNEYVSGIDPGTTAGDAAAGRIRIYYADKTGDDGIPLYKNIQTGNSKTVTIVPSSTLAHNSGTDNNYYICILPQTFENGITVTVTTSTGETYEKSSNNPLTLGRNEIVNLGRLEAPAEDDGSLTLSLPMDKSKLPEGFPTAKESAGLDRQSYEFDFSGQKYQFVFHSDAADGRGGQTADRSGIPGYYYNTTDSYYNMGATYAYIQFPAIEGMRLASASVTSANTSGNRHAMITKVPFTQLVMNPSDFVSDIDGTSVTFSTAAPTHNWTFDDTKPNTSYYLQIRNGQLWIKNLVLKYVPATESDEVGQELPAWSEGYMDIHCINSGNGECSFFILPDGTTMLVDAGEYVRTEDTDVARKPNDETRPYKVYANYIKNYLPSGKTSIDWCAPSHLHVDHIGQSSTSTANHYAGGFPVTGITGVYSEVPFDRLLDYAYNAYDNSDTSLSLMDGEFVTSDNWKKFVDWAVTSRGMRADRFTLNTDGTPQITLVYNASNYNNFSITNTCVNASGYYKKDGNPYIETLVTNEETRTTFKGNPSSAGFHIRYGKFDYIGAGDLATGSQNRLAYYYRDFGTDGLDVFKANHHLSADSWGSQMQATANNFTPRVILGHITKVAQPNINIINGITGTYATVKAGWTEKDIFLTNLDASRTDVADKIKDYNGHIVVRVAPGGESYKVYMLEDGENYKYKIKAVYSFNCK